MVLSEDEARRLAELADGLVREDPRLGHALTDHRLPRRFHRKRASPLTRASTEPTFSGPAASWPLQLLATTLVAMSMPLLITGVLLEQAWMYGVGAFALLAGPVCFLAARRIRRPPSI